METNQHYLPGAGNPLAAALADEEAVAGAPHVLAPGRGVPDGRGLVADWTLHYVLHNLTVSRGELRRGLTHLIFLPRDVDHVAADPAAHHGHPARHSVVGGRQFVRSDGDHSGGGGPPGGAGGGVGHSILCDGLAQQRLSLNVIRHHSTLTVFQWAKLLVLSPLLLSSL